MIRSLAHLRPERPTKDSRDRMGIFSSGHNPICGFTRLFEREEGCCFFYQNDVLYGEQVRFEQPVPYRQWLHVAVTPGWVGTPRSICMR